MQIRINKYISESGYCSRREADKYIEQGGVTINGKKAEIGSQVSVGQEVKVFGEVIQGRTQSVLIAYNKPVGVVSTTDLSEHNNIVDAIGHDERIFPVGRLDKDSQGLILLTNEGDVVNKILRVNNNHDKEYFVMVDKPVTEEFINKMQNGIPILGVVTRKCELTKRDVNSFNIVLRQGLNRQIRRMCEYLGYNVIKLERVRVMHIKLGNLRVGQWRNLTSAEVEILRRKIESSIKTEEASRTKPKSKATKSSQTKTDDDKSAKFKSNKGTKAQKEYSKSSSTKTDDKPQKGTKPLREQSKSKSSSTKSDDKPSKFKPQKGTKPLREQSKSKSSPTKSDDKPSKFKPQKGTKPLREQSKSKSSSTKSDDKPSKFKPQKGTKPLREQSKSKSSPTKSDDKPSKFKPQKGTKPLREQSKSKSKGKFSKQASSNNKKRSAK